MGDDPGSRRVVGDWEILHKIGSGSFAIVWKAVHQNTQVEAAVKEINTANLNRKLQDSLASEITVLEKTRHPNIVGLLDIIKDGSRIFIVLEYCSGGDLGNFIKRYKKVQEATAKQFMHQLAEGLKELRSLNLVHRDLKPQNLLLSSRFTPGGAFPLLKIADFGFARSLHPQTLADTLCGSPLYMAPEILQAQRYGAKADLWSVGVILFELVAGKPPFGGNNHVQLLHNINTTEARLPDAVAACLSDSCRSLLRLLLRRNPVDRLTFEEFFAHPFIQDSGAATPSPAPPLLPPEPPLLGEAGDPQEAFSHSPPSPGLLSEALKKTISRWTSQHAAATAASPRRHETTATAAGPSGSASAKAEPQPLPQPQPVPSPRWRQQQQQQAESSPPQRTSVTRQLSAGGSSAAAVVQNLLMGLSPPRLPPLFSFGGSHQQQEQQPAAASTPFSTPAQQPSQQQQQQQQQHPASVSGTSGDDFFDHDFVIVASPQPRANTPAPTPQLLFPRVPTPEHTLPFSPTPGDRTPSPATTTTAGAPLTLRRAPSRSALTTQLAAAAAASGSSTPLSGSGTLLTPPASTTASLSGLPTPSSRSPTPPLPHSFPATCPIHHPEDLQHPQLPATAPTAPTSAGPSSPGPTATVADHPLKSSQGDRSTTPPLPCSYSATHSVLLANAPPTLMPPSSSDTPDSAATPTATQPPPTPGTAATPAVPSAAAKRPTTTQAQQTGTKMAPSSSAAAEAAPAAPAAPAAATTAPAPASQAAQPRQAATRLTTSTNPVLPPVRLQRLLSDGIAAVASNVDVSALLPRVVAVLLDRCERLAAPPQQLQPAVVPLPPLQQQRQRQQQQHLQQQQQQQQQQYLQQLLQPQRPVAGPPAGGLPAAATAAPTPAPAPAPEAPETTPVEALGLRLAAMQLLQAACGEPRFRPQSPAAAAALQELARRADEGLARALAAAPPAAARQGAAAAGFGALLQCVRGLCHAGGALEQAGGPQRRAALVEYASAMDVLLLLLLDAGSAGGPKGRAAVEHQLLKMYGAVATRWTAAGGGTI